MIICGVIITGKSALKGVKAKGDQAYGRAREDAKRRRKISEERKAKRAKMREQEQKAAKNTNSNEVLCVKVRWGQLRLPMKLRVLQQKLRRQQRL